MLRITVGGMRCEGCARGVAAALREAAPGASARVDLARGEAVLEGPADAEAVLAALRAEGWEATLLPGPA